MAVVGRHHATPHRYNLRKNNKGVPAIHIVANSGGGNYWLAKQEPDGPRGYSIDRLKADGKTVWDGVHNNLALKHMGNMRRGDLVMYYHTGGERQAVGIMNVVKNPYPNPEEDNPRFIAVDVRYREHLKNPVTLDQMKAQPGFAKWEMLRISRLSVMPVPASIWKKIISMSASPPPAAAGGRRGRPAASRGGGDGSGSPRRGQSRSTTTTTRAAASRRSRPSKAARSR